MVGSTNKIAALLLTAACAMAQERPAFRAGVASVRVDTLVTINQQPLKGLQPGDFVLRENGETRSVQAVWYEELPLDIVLLMPTWVTRPGLNPDKTRNTRIREEAERSLLSVRPEDRVALVTYGARPPNVDLPFTSDQNRLDNAIFDASRPQPRVETLWALPMAIEFAVRMFQKETERDPEMTRNRRRVILLIETLLFGYITPFPDDPIIRRLWQENIVLSRMFALPRGWNASSRPYISPSNLNRMQPNNPAYRRSNPVHIARATGGEGLKSVGYTEPADLLSHLRQRYIVWFDRPDGIPPGLERRIQVDLSEEARGRYPDAAVQARLGYVTQ